MQKNSQNTTDKQFGCNKQLLSKLVGGFKYFICPPLLGERFPIWPIFFNGLKPPTRSTPVRVRIDREKTRKNSEGGPFEVWKLGGNVYLRHFQGDCQWFSLNPEFGILCVFKIQSLTPFKKGVIPRFHSSHRNSFIAFWFTYGCFQKWWYPTTMGFPTKNDHFGVFWGYFYFWKHPYRYASRWFAVVIERDVFPQHPPVLVVFETYKGSS